MKQRTPSKRHRDGFTFKEILISLLIIIIGVAVVWSTVTYYNIQGETRRILRDAKNINLAIQYLSVETYGTDKILRDTRRRNGFSEWAEKEIKTLAEIDGEVYLVYQNPNHLNEVEIWYSKGEYTARLNIDSNNEVSYLIYRDAKVVK